MNDEKRTDAAAAVADHTTPSADVEALAATREALRREVGPTGHGDGNWQPMVAASEIWALLDALDAADARVQAARDDERARARQAVDAVERVADSIHGDAGWEHNGGCEGEPDCFAYIEADLRRIADEARGGAR